MGPNRVNWTFPYNGKELVERCEQIEAELVDLLNESLTAEQNHERELAEYRERLRVAGVKDWEFAKLDPGGSGYARGIPEDHFRRTQRKWAERLEEIGQFKRQLLHDLARDDARLYKLTIDDIRFFGL